MILLPNIAVLITCYNRKEKTLKCLDTLFLQLGLNVDFKIEVFLVDDCSTDGTSELIKVKFPNVNIISGNGELFWNGGMRLAWQTASGSKEFDYYFLLNDDTYLDSNCIKAILFNYEVAKVISNTDVLITGACRKSLDLNEFSYGGSDDNGPVIPNQKLQQCLYVNGNILLVPMKVYLKLGILSSDYTHGFGDFDYGLRAIQNGFMCFTTLDYIGTCEPHFDIPVWCNPDYSLFERWKNFNSPLGLNIREYNLFRKKFWGRRWVLFLVKACFKMLFPMFYMKLAKK